MPTPTVASWPSGSGGTNQKELLAIAGNTSVLVKLQATANYANGENTHFARDDISTLQVVFPNWYVDYGGSTFLETGSGAAITIEASVVYPAGIFTRITFSGNTSGTIPNGGKLTSDVASVSIPKGKAFQIRYNLVAPSGTPYIELLYSGVGGSKFEYSASPVTNKVLGGLITNTVAGIGYMPTAIIGLTSCKSVMVIGDSKCRGAADVADSSLSVGNLCRSLNINYIADGNFGVSADTLTRFKVSNTMRFDTMQYFKNIIIEYGISDMALHLNEYVKSLYLEIISKIPDNKGVGVCTIEPKTTSTDAWATTTNQTVIADEFWRLDFNSWIRGGSILDADFYIDLDYACSSSYNSGFWAVPSKTTDGVHANQAGNLLPILAKVVRPESIKSPGFTKVRAPLVYSNIMSLTWNSSGAKTITNIANIASYVLVRYTSGDGNVQNQVFSKTVTAGDSLVLSTPFPELIVNVNLGSKGVTGVFDNSKFPNLGILDISGNTFNGAYPDPANCPNLTSWKVQNNSFTAGALPSFAKCPLLTTIDSGVVGATGSIPDISANTALTYFAVNANSLNAWAGGTLASTITTFKATTNALPSATINALLAAIVAGGSRAIAVTLQGGTNGAPTGQGIVDKATIAAWPGASITTN